MRLSHIHKFEKMTARKIVVFYRGEGNCPLSQFETSSPKSGNSLFYVYRHAHALILRNKPRIIAETT